MATTAIQIELLNAGIFLNGKPLARGKIKSFLAGTSTLSALFKDAAEVANHSNPLSLDDEGKVIAFGNTEYKFEIFDENDVLLDTLDTLTYKLVPGDVVTLSNDGAGSGVDADLLDGNDSGNASGNIPISNGVVNTNLNAQKFNGLLSTQFLRSDVADQADGIITFAVNATLNNDINLIGKEVGGTGRNLAVLNSNDKVVIGDSANPIGIRGSGNNPKFENPTESDIIHERDERSANAHGRVSAAGSLTGGFGIASITKNGTGDYTANISITMANTNYGIAVEAVDRNTSIKGTSLPTTTSFRYVTQDSSGTLVDAEHFVTIVGARA